MHQILLAAGAIAALSAAVPARAVSVVDGSCAIGASSGCLFLGSLTAATVAETQAKFNLYNDSHILAGSNIALAYLFSSNSPGFPGVRTGVASGTWSAPGYNIRYLGVAAGPNFAIYKLPVPASSGSWSTAAIPHGANLRELRNLVFFGGAVPEPATWATLLAGFGLVGIAVRNRRRPGLVVKAA